MQNNYQQPQQFVPPAIANAAAANYGSPFGMPTAQFSAPNSFMDIWVRITQHPGGLIMTGVLIALTIVFILLIYVMATGSTLSATTGTISNGLIGLSWLGAAWYVGFILSVKV